MRVQRLAGRSWFGLSPACVCCCDAVAFVATVGCDNKSTRRWWNEARERDGRATDRAAIKRSWPCRAARQLQGADVWRLQNLSDRDHPRSSLINENKKARPHTAHITAD